ncbi:MAG TPA: hypothetical protein VNB24_02930 [Acidimicrobiales bacterium]|nr:hypothetical protein [Acidimicrobiales bacterium]
MDVVTGATTSVVVVVAGSVDATARDVVAVAERGVESPLHAAADAASSAVAATTLRT